MHIEAELERLRAWCAAMPPVAAMQVRVDGYRDERLVLRAPLAANVNDKGTAFGGSLVSLMTLAGWGLATLHLRLHGLEADVFVADSQVRYKAPLYDELVASAWLAPDQSWDDFIATFRQRGRARIGVEAEVRLPDGGVATTLAGRYVALAKR